MGNVTDPASITLCVNGRKYTAEGLDWDITAEDLLDNFKHLLVAAEYSLTVLNDEDGGYEYVRYDEEKENDALRWRPGKFDDSDWYGKKHNNPLLDSPTC